MIIDISPTSQYKLVIAPHLFEASFKICKHYKITSQATFKVLTTLLAWFHQTGLFFCHPIQDLAILSGTSLAQTKRALKELNKHLIIKKRRSPRTRTENQFGYKFETQTTPIIFFDNILRRIRTCN